MERGPVSVSMMEWIAVSAWADELAAALASRHDRRYIAILIHDAPHGLRLTGQQASGGADRGLAIVGETYLPLEASICGRVFRTGMPALLADVRMDPEYHPFLGAIMRSELAVPIRDRERIIGVVNLESPSFSAFDIDDLADVVARIGEALETFPSA
jgi:GAF domain-containing protein